MKTFEELWNDCENSQVQLTSSDFNSLLDEISLKINMIKNINNKIQSVEAKKEAIEFMYGEMLYTMTGISLIENINVYPLMNKVLQDKLKGNSSQ